MHRATSGPRGKHYSREKALIEHALRVLYAGGWPAKLWQLVPGSTEVEVVRLRLPVLPAHASALRVAFASDFHLGPTTPERLLDRAFAALHEAEPDLLVLGGDYVFLEATPERARRLRGLVEGVKARSKVAVLGNHDLWADHGLLQDHLEQAGVCVLVNEWRRLPDPHGAVCVVGLDEPWTGSPDPEAALRDCPKEAARILVCHAPDGFTLVPSGVALYLAGHTHGGHIALPGGLPIVLPPGPGSRRWPRGLYEVGEGKAFVSKGVGGAEVPVRTFARPEIVLLELGPKRRA